MLVYTFSAFSHTLLSQVNMGNFHLLNLQGTRTIQMLRATRWGNFILRRTPLVHAIVGCSLMIASFVQVPIGIYLLHPGSSILYGYCVVMLCWLLVFVAMELRRRRQNRPASKDTASIAPELEAERISRRLSKRRPHSPRMWLGGSERRTLRS
jgi:hypothetical protein